MTRKEQIKNLLESRFPLSPAEIAGELDMTASHVRGLLREMKIGGEVESPSRGQYRLKQNVRLHVIGEDSKVFGHTLDQQIELDEHERVLMHYRQFINNIPYCVAMFDTEARFIVVTKTYIKVFAIEDQLPIQGKRIIDIFQGDDVQDYYQSLVDGDPHDNLSAGKFKINEEEYSLAWRTTPWHYKGLLGGWLCVLAVADVQTGEPVSKLGTIHYGPEGPMIIEDPGFMIETGGGDYPVRVVKFTYNEDGLITSDDVSKNSLTFNRTNLIKAIDNIIKSQIPEEELDMLLDNSGGSYRIDVTSMVRRLGGQLRKIRVEAIISNVVNNSDQKPDESPKKQDSTEAEWKPASG